MGQVQHGLFWIFFALRYIRTQKDPAVGRASRKTGNRKLPLVVVAMSAVMAAGSVCRNNRTSQNYEGDDSEKHIAQLHVKNPLMT